MTIDLAAALLPFWTSSEDAHSYRKGCPACQVSSSASPTRSSDGIVDCLPTTGHLTKLLLALDSILEPVRLPFWPFDLEGFGAI